MEFVFIIILAIFVISLNIRIKKLELLVKNNKTQEEVVPSTEIFQNLQPGTVTLDSLPDYIKQQFQKGLDIQEIKEILLANNWHLSEIDEALRSMNSEKVQLDQPDQNVEVSVSTDPTAFNRFAEWLKKDWLLKIGALFLLIGFGWLTTYAFINNWIGPMGRITLGIVAGALFLLLGGWRIKKYIHQGGVFLVLGSTIILLTIFAAREVYGFFTPFSALAITFFSTAFVAFASVRYKSVSLSLISLILAGIAPLLTDFPSHDYVNLFVYLFVVVLGTIWVVALTGQRVLNIAALLLVVFYSLPHLLPFTHGADMAMLLIIIYGFSAVFFITNTIGVLKLEGKKIVPDLITAAGNGMLLLSWIVVAAQDEWKSLIISAWMFVFVIASFSIFRLTKKKEPFYIYVGVGIVMLAVATATELNGAALTIAYTIESAVISFVSYLVIRDIRIAERMNLLLIGPAVLSFGSITSYAWSEGVIHKDFFVLLILCLTILGLGLLYRRSVKEIEEEGPKQINASLLIVGSLYAYVILWLSLHAKFQNDNTAVMISLVVYTIIGLIFYFYGLGRSKKVLTIYGGILVGFVVMRLFLVDVWDMELTGRITIFFLIGALLVSTAFLGKKKQKLNLPNNN